MQRYLSLALLVALFVAFRILGSVLPDSQPNFQPLTALFFCGAMLAPSWRGFAIPFGIWAVTYPFGIGPVGDLAVVATTLLGLTITFFLGIALSKRGFPALLLGAVFAAGVFHLITNGAAWLGSPMYDKSLTGLWQSLWTGPLGSSIPSWVFLRNMAAANLIFTGLFALAQFRLPNPTITSSDWLPAK